MVVLKSIALIVAGILTWPAAEYLLHRFLGHELAYRSLFKREHQTHHSVKDFFAPGYYKIAAAAAVMAILYFLGAPLLYSGSFVLMYLFYEWTHYSFHQYPPKTNWGRTMRKHHFAHHFMHAKSNYGVTTNWFDRLGNTNQNTTLVKVPRAFAMKWLVDESGKVKHEYKNDFTIK